jgi:hypothetical protein
LIGEVGLHRRELTLHQGGQVDGGRVEGR